jgi:sugar fermentation stimulation protein A
MRFANPLVPATLVRRYKRFLADVRFDDGEEAVAHCANSGSMLGLAVPGARVWLSPSPNPKAKLGWRWELEETAGGLVGINTSHPNALVAEAIAAQRIPELAGYGSVRREVAYGTNSRIDLWLSGAGPDCLVEVKNVTLRRGTLAEFPDSVTSRGAKHLVELAAQVREGRRAVMLFCIQRMDCTGFAVAGDLDAAYAAAFRAAQVAGVETYAYTCTLTPESITLDRAVPMLVCATKD